MIGATKLCNDSTSGGLAMAKRLALWLTALWCGGAVMGFELAGARLLMPAFGTGIQVWAAVIATTLVALAAGYAAGGRVADARPSALLLAGLVAVAGCGLLVVWGAGRRLVEACQGMSLGAGAWCAAPAVLALPLWVLGTVQPFLARLLLGARERAGRVVGGLLAVSTLGGVAGTVLTGVVLIPRLGVSATLLGLGVGTVAMALILSLASRGWAAGLAVALAGTASGAAGWWLWHAASPGGPMRVLERAEGFYGDLEVVEHRGLRMLVCNGIVQTAMPTSGPGIAKGALLRGRDYMELIPYLRPLARTALIVGLGGALHERMLACYGIECHGVEIDPEVVRLAAEHFGLACAVTVADGRAFLARDARRFDAIVLDAFLGGTVPEHLYTREAFAQAAERLTPDGVLAVHLIGRPGHRAVRAVARTLEAVFPHRLAARGGAAGELQHLYLFASREPLRLPQAGELYEQGFTGAELCDIATEGAPLLTDDRTCLALLSRDIVAEHRRKSLALRRNPPW